MLLNQCDIDARRQHQEALRSEHERARLAARLIREGVPGRRPRGVRLWADGLLIRLSQGALERRRARPR